MSIIFEWNRKKAEQNKKKHGITFEEAATVFGDPLSLTMPDPQHSFGEERFVTLGVSKENGVLVVVHKDKGDIIRIISARRANKKEKLNYEEK